VTAARITASQARRWVWLSRVPEGVFETVLAETRSLATYAPNGWAFERLLLNRCARLWLRLESRIPRPPWWRG
jgi:hypothetical protein